jgi:hypothetical protein
MGARAVSLSFEKLTKKSSNTAAEHAADTNQMERHHRQDRSLELRALLSARLKGGAANPVSACRRTVVSSPLLLDKSSYGNVGPMDDWCVGLRWEVEDDTLHILQLQERITVAWLYGLNPENGIHS